MKTVLYPCISVATEDDEAEELSYNLHDLGALAIEWRDESTMTKSSANRCEFIAGFPSVELRDSALLQLKSEIEDHVTIKAIDVEDDGWSSRWREFFSPVILERIQIVTPWMDLPRQDLIPIVIDPAQAFGTGGHATTRLVLKLLEQRSMKSKLPDSILDVGTGSGVLAVAAIKLGATRVTGIDVDAEAVAAAKKNARENNVADDILFERCEAADLRDTFDLVLANIELRIFTQCAADIASLVAQGGAVIISGILENQVDEAIALWPGFTVTDTRIEDGWVALELCLKT